MCLPGGGQAIADRAVAACWMTVAREGPMLDVRRREFITCLGGAAAWPLAARAQQTDRVPRVGVLMSVAADGPEGQARLSAFLKGLQQLGWTDGRNVRIDYRWGAGDAERSRKYAAELVTLGPDVILASGDPVMALQQATRNVPIVFTIIADPVGAGLVESLARPGGNSTGFTAKGRMIKHVVRTDAHSGSMVIKPRRTRPAPWQYAAPSRSPPRTAPRPCACPHRPSRGPHGC
jgi:hypothetical protein